MYHRLGGAALSRGPMQLGARVTLLDGGTGEELLTKRGVVDDRKTWSAVAVSNSQYHQSLYDVHMDFLRAGSEYLTCNNFGITPGVGFSRERMRTLTRLSGEICTRARDDYERMTGGLVRRKVLGSLPPLVESYRADRVMEYEKGVEVYRECIIDVLDDLVDGWIAETLSGSKECIMALDALDEGAKPGEHLSGQDTRDVFVSMTVKKDGFVRSGEKAGEAIGRIIDHIYKNNGTRCHLIGILFNCSRPEDISLALDNVLATDHVVKALDTHHISLGAYPNRLTEIPDDWALDDYAEPQETRKDLSPDAFVAFCKDWVVNKHVQILGGCCGIGPEYIERLCKEDLHIPQR